MRKIKPRVGATVAWRIDSFPFIAVDVIITLVNGDCDTKQGHFIEADRRLFCVSEDSHDELAKTVVDLRLKHDTSLKMMLRRLGDIRKRSVLGQLDPRS